MVRGSTARADGAGRADLLTSTDPRFDFGEVFETMKDTEINFTPFLAQNNYDARELVPYLHPGTDATLYRTISNSDRFVGAALSGHLAAEFLSGQPSSRLTVNFTGVAGQSFGAFLAKGVTFNLHGSANDYVGKSLSGGIITIVPPENPGFRPEDNVIAGNVIAYGGTSGAIYINGQAGERFGIRNSGATLVVEGIGDHGCEYMTGGVAVILGPVGVNFAAGMTGGIAYVYDESDTLDLNSNLDSVDLFPIGAEKEDESALLALLEEHVARTGSPKARRLLAVWPEVRHKFIKVAPLKALTFATPHGA